MIDITDELRKLVTALAKQRIDYALCGGMAMGVHGFLRTTIDIDLPILSESLDDAFAVANSLGYGIRGKEVSFAHGSIEIRRVSKIDPDDGELLSLDLLLVTPDIRSAWDSRIEADWEGRKLSVVSRDALIALKTLRSSPQDLADIQALNEFGTDETG
jgi:hypothetical protein